MPLAELGLEHRDQFSMLRKTAICHDNCQFRNRLTCSFHDIGNLGGEGFLKIGHGFCSLIFELSYQHCSCAIQSGRIDYVQQHSLAFNSALAEISSTGAGLASALGWFRISLRELIGPMVAMRG